MALNSPNLSYLAQTLVRTYNTKLLRTPVGTGALQCTTCYSYLGVHCSGFEDVDFIETRLSTLYTLLC